MYDDKYSLDQFVTFYVDQITVSSQTNCSILKRVILHVLYIGVQFYSPFQCDYYRKQINTYILYYQYKTYLQNISRSYQNTMTLNKTIIWRKFYHLVFYITQIMLYIYIAMCKLITLLQKVASLYPNDANFNHP